MTDYNPGDIVKYRYDSANIGLMKIIGPGDDEDEFTAEWIEVPPAAAFYSWNKPGTERFIQRDEIIDLVSSDDDEEFGLVFDNDEIDIIVQALLFAAHFNANEDDAIEALRLARKIHEEF